MTVPTLFRTLGLAASLSLAAAGASALAAPGFGETNGRTAGVPQAMLGEEPRGEAGSGEAERPVQLAQGNCSGAAAQAAAQTGGQVLSVSSREQNGRVVCVVTVLVPGKDGGRPRRTTITVPG